MKKSFLILTIIAAGLFMTSCLDDNETTYSGTPLSYVTTSESGVIYARTLDGLPISSPQIKEQEPGSFIYIDYFWAETQNTITEERIFNVTVNNISDPLQKTVMINGEAPVLETEIPLESFQPLLYVGSYFDYHWICGYGYEVGDGNRKTLRFYHNLAEGKENEVIIDIRLVNDVTGTVDKDQADIPIAVNLEQIHNYYLVDLPSVGEQKDIRVYFRYYRKNPINDAIELYKTPQSSTMTIVKE